MRWVLVVASLSLVAACDGGDDGPRPLERIDGPAQVDPDFIDGGGAATVPDPDG